MRVAVFAKAPRPGAVKTRLAGFLGEEGAARLHARLVEHALAMALDAAVGPVELWAAPSLDDPFFAECARRHGVSLRDQGDGDLGARMARAVAASISAGDAVLVIGSDCPALRAGDLHEAAAELAGHDVVLGPAEDGGYVLLGAARTVPPIFERVDWGSGTVLARTRHKLAAAGIEWHELRTLWDVDRPEDYVRLQQEGLLEVAGA